MFSPVAKDSAALRSAVFLGLLTLLCLLPFSNKAFNIDDPLFIWAAHQITAHPWDPFGFNIVWYETTQHMFEVTKNPPLASYYIAACARIAGWSERALHLAFVFPALGVILGTYQLARRFTAYPLIAATATLLTPGFLVSSTSVMCDTLMLFFWVLAAYLWIRGVENGKRLALLASALLMTASALTKYFGVALVPLLASYTLARQRRFGAWIWYLLIPAVLLVAYQLWTRELYGWGLLSSAYYYSKAQRHWGTTSPIVKGLVDLSFLGGCTITGLTLAPLLWSRRQILIALAVATMAAWPIGMGWLNLGDTSAPRDFREHSLLLSAELTLWIAIGISLLALAIADLWKRRDASSLFLSLWVFGTFIFAGFLNWTNNARSILPLIPAAGILLARRLESIRMPQQMLRRAVVLSLVVAGVLSFWITWGDAELANANRSAATLIAGKTALQASTVWFEGHWGLQYYLESLGAHPVDVPDLDLRAGDFLVMSENNRIYFCARKKFVSSKEVIEIGMHSGVTTLQANSGAGFYASTWGPAPFVIGPVPPERYYLLRLSQAFNAKQQGF